MEKKNELKGKEMSDIVWVSDNQNNILTKDGKLLEFRAIHVADCCECWFRGDLDEDDLRCKDAPCAPNMRRDEDAGVFVKVAECRMNK